MYFICPSFDLHLTRISFAFRCSGRADDFRLPSSAAGTGRRRRLVRRGQRRPLLGRRRIRSREPRKLFHRNLHRRPGQTRGRWLSQSVLFIGKSNFPSDAMYHPDDTLSIAIYCCVSSGCNICVLLVPSCTSVVTIIFYRHPFSSTQGDSKASIRAGFLYVAPRQRFGLRRQHEGDAETRPRRWQGPRLLHLPTFRDLWPAP